MKAAYITTPGPPESIQFGDIPVPTPTGNQVLVKVGAVAVNPIDTYVRSGAVAMPLPNPFVVGCDLAGTVEAVGPDVQFIKTGDRVWGSNQGVLGRQGTFAEYACVEEPWLYPTPKKVKDADAAACALVGITAHLGVFQRGNLHPGETVLVVGGSGGVGSMVVQLAKAIGANVIATAGDDKKAKLCRKLGADVVINYSKESIADKARQYAPDGVQLFWETRREPDFDLTVNLLAERGRMILMAGRDARPEFPVGPFYVKGASIHGLVMFKFSADEQRVCAEDISTWLEQGKIKARIDRTMPLSETAEAHRVQEASTVGGEKSLAGKIVLTP